MFGLRTGAPKRFADLRYRGGMSPRICGFAISLSISVWQKGSIVYVDTVLDTPKTPTPAINTRLIRPSSHTEPDTDWFRVLSLFVFVSTYILWAIIHGM
jgi:hypothetical protein